MLSRTSVSDNQRQRSSKKLLLSVLTHPSYLFEIDLSPCHAIIQPMSQQRADASLYGYYACYAVSLHLVHIPHHSVNL